MKVATALMCVCNVVGTALVDLPEGRSAAFKVGLAATFGAVTVASFVVLWFFWRGRNWARWLVIAMSVVALLSMWPMGTEGPLLMTFLAAQGILGAWLLFWLNTRVARAFFGGGERREDASTEDERQEQ